MNNLPSPESCRALRGPSRKLAKFRKKPIAYFDSRDNFASQIEVLHINFLGTDVGFSAARCKVGEPGMDESRDRASDMSRFAAIVVEAEHKVDTLFRDIEAAYATLVARPSACSWKCLTVKSKYRVRNISANLSASVSGTRAELTSASAVDQPLLAPIHIGVP